MERITALLCRYANPSGEHCNCPKPSLYLRCTNEKRLSAIEERADGAAFHTLKDKSVVRADYCSRRHCVDFEPQEVCRYAIATDRPWAGDLADCRVVECHNPTALVELHGFYNKEGVSLGGARRPCLDDLVTPIDGADYLEVRSRFCNKEFCWFYSESSQHDGMCSENEKDSGKNIGE